MNNFKLDISTIKKRIFYNSVISIKISCIDGELGVYPGHTPLLTVIKLSMICIVDKNSNKEYLYLSEGIMEIKPNIVIILVDNAVYSHNLNETELLKMKNIIEQKINNNVINSKEELRDVLITLKEICIKLKIIKLKKEIILKK